MCPKKSVNLFCPGGNTLLCSNVVAPLVSGSNSPVSFLINISLPSIPFIVVFTGISKPKNGGKECPILENTTSCNIKNCDVDCVVSDWPDYGVCSKPCGVCIKSIIIKIIT